MSETNIEFLAILRHYFKQGLKATEAARKIREFEGENSISDRTAQNWFKRFKEGDLSLQIQHRCGRPSTVDFQALREAVEAYPSTSTRRLSSDLGPSKDTICRALHQLQKINKRCREVPHELTPEQARRRVEICKQLLQNTLDFRFFKRIVTCDEKWIYLRNPDTSNQWLDVGDPGLPVAKRGRFEKKIMLCVWWNYEGVIHFELVLNGRSINAELYSEKLDRMYDKLKEKYPALINRNRALLQQDNAKPHTAIQTKEKISLLLRSF